MHPFTEQVMELMLFILGSRERGWRKHTEMKKTVPHPCNRREMRTDYMLSEFGGI